MTAAEEKEQLELERQIQENGLAGKVAWIQLPDFGWSLMILDTGEQPTIRRDRV